MPLDDSPCANNPASEDPIRTVADALDRLETLSSLNHAKRQRYRSSLTSACRLLELPAERLAFTRAALIGGIRALHPTRCGLSCKRLQNLGSDLRAVIRLLLGDRHHWLHGYPLTAEWATVIDSIPSRWDRMSPAAFARFASYRGIRPAGVDDDVVLEYLAFLTTEQICRNAELKVRNLRSLWNRLGREVEGWPAIVLPVTDRRRERSWTLPWAALSASLKADSDACFGYGGDNQLFSDKPGRALRPSTLRLRLDGIRACATAAVRATGCDPADLELLADLLKLDTLKALTYWLRDKSGLKPQSVALHLKALRVAAKHHVRAPTEVQRALAQAIRKIEPPKRERLSMTERNRIGLRQFDNPEILASLLRYPANTHRRIAALPRIGRRDALDMAFALAVEIELMVPIRIQNLAGLHLDRHLLWNRGASADTLHILIPGEEVKNGQNLMFQLPVLTIRLLRFYLDRCRPLLCGPENRYLFPGRGAAAKLPANFGKQVVGRLQRDLGIEMHMHLFRHLAGKLVLNSPHGSYELVRQLLGNRSMEVILGNYTGEEVQDNLRRYGEMIQQMRSGEGS
jgi:hypothetical protein